MGYSYKFLLKEVRKDLHDYFEQTSSFNAWILTEEIERCLEECSSDPEVRVVIITGAGAAFCAGGDIQEFDSNPKGAAYVCQEVTKYLNRAIIEIRRMPQPVIACINGGVGGGGLAAAACDHALLQQPQSLVSYTRIGPVRTAWTLTIPLLRVGDGFWSCSTRIQFSRPRKRKTGI